MKIGLQQKEKRKLAKVTFVFFLISTFYLTYAKDLVFFKIPLATNQVGQENIESTINFVDIQLQGVPNDTIVDCNFDVVNVATLPITGTTSIGCGPVSISYNRVVADSMCQNKKRIYNIWTATDICSNICRDTQVVIVDNVRLLTLFQEGAMDTFVCSSDFLSIYNSNINLDGQCGIVEQNYNLNFISRGCVNKRDYSFTWRVVDECNNIFEGSQMISIRDTIRPSIQNVPDNISVECSEDVPLPHGSVTATDNCGVTGQSPLSLIVQRFVQDSMCPEKKVILYVWSATDACSNIVRDTQKITVISNSVPTIATIPGDLTLNCACDEPDRDTSIFPVDNCGFVSLDFQRQVYDSLCINNKKIRNIWIATSSCGILFRDTQVITVVDLVPPSILNVPSNLIVSCAENVPVQSSIVTAVEDLCDSVNCIKVPFLTFNRVLVDSTCLNNKTIKYLWTATDNCGNMSRDSQIISVRDLINPTLLSVPGNVTVSCAANVPGPANVTATDNCTSGATVSLLRSRVDSTCLNNKTIKYLWTATDNCGNMSRDSQIVSVRDTTPPIINNNEIDTINLFCEMEVPPIFKDVNELLLLGIDISEACCLDSMSLQLETEDVIEENNVTYTTRVYSLEDCCDNASTYTVVYRSIDDCLADLAIKKEIVGSRPYIVDNSTMTIRFRVTVYNQFGISVDSIKLVDYKPSRGTQITSPGWTNLGDEACLTLSVENGLLPSVGLEAGDSVILEYNMLIEIAVMRPIVYNFIEIAEMKGLDGQVIEDVDSTPDDVFGNDGQIPTDQDKDPKFEEDDISGVVFFNCKSLECNALVNVSLDENCEAIIDPSFLNGSYKGLPYRLELFDKKGNLIPDNKLTSEHIGQKIRASVINIDVCRANSCWGYLYIEDKLPPVLMTPKDTTVYCLGGLTPSKTGQATAEDCSEYKVKWRDVLITKKDKCEIEGDTLQVICREWIAMDIFGMMVRDTQKIIVLSLPDSLIRVPTPTLLFSCGASTHPDSIMKYYGVKDAYPHYKNPTTGEYNRIGLGESCNLAASYTDGPKSYICGEYCGGSYKMIRTWTILNWCTGRSRTMHQIIKVEDKEAPVVEVTEPTTIYNTNAWKCGMDLDLPEGVAIDECDASPRIVRVEGPLGVRVERIGGRWRAYDVPKGETVFTYTAADCCGNIGDTEITIRVEDRVAPVPVAKEFITVSLTASNDTAITGIAKLRVENIDNGSYDNCSPIYREIRREGDAPSCLNEGELYDHDSNSSTPMIRWNNNITYNGRKNALHQLTSLHLNDNVNDTDLGQEVKFCCEDIGKEVKVYLRVWDDGDMDGIFGSSGDNYNETWTIVKVEDKSIPNLSCKPTIITNCKSDSARVFVGMGWLDVEERIEAGLLPRISSVCAQGLKLEFKDEGSLTSCNTTLPQQVLRRLYRVKGTDVTCLQEIIIQDVPRNPDLDYPIEIMKWNKCTLTEADVLAKTWRATKASALPEKGYGTIVARNSAGEPLLYRPDISDIGCALYGRRIKIEEYETEDGCKKWVVRFDYINWCDIEEKYYREVTYKYEDTTAPEITGYSITDTVDVNAVSCRASWSVTPEGTDPGNDCEGGLAWKVTLVKGTTTVEQTAKGSKPTVNFTNLASGTYKIFYKLTDACGNATTKEGVLLVRDKKPTPYCISLSSAVMKDGTVELWAEDFDKGSFGNCKNKVVYFTFDEAHPVLSKLNRAHYFRGKGVEVTGADTSTLYKAGEIQKWLPKIIVRPRPNLPGGAADPRGPDTTVLGGSSARLFGCKVGNGSTFPRAEVKMSVWDENLNTDFCTVELFLVDNMGDCGGHSLASIIGNISTMNKEPMKEVAVELYATLPEYPVKRMTDASGTFRFDGLPIGAKYEIKPSKTNDYLNGVNTLDLVQIQRHILGIKKLEDPYLMIAADADGDKAIRVSDIVELRKLILGISEKLPNVDSWKMVKKNQGMGSTPWPFDETITHGILKEDQKENDFIGVKVGDVDGSANANAISHQTAPRSIGIGLSIEDKEVKVGEEIEVMIQVADFTDIHGMQFTLAHHGLELTSTEGRALALSQEHIGSPKVGVTTLSWTSDHGVSVEKGLALVKLTFRSTVNTSISKSIAITSDVTAAEAYKGKDMEQVGISLETRNVSTIDAITLSQNEPNPWKESTIIRYTLPNASEVTLKVVDMAGKVLFTRKVKGEKGENTTQITKNELTNYSGLLQYILEVDKQVLQKRMIVIE